MQPNDVNTRAQLPQSLEYEAALSKLEKAASISVENRNFRVNTSARPYGGP